MTNKCRPKHILYEYEYWTGNNLVELRNFCNGKIYWSDKFEGKLILYGKNDNMLNQIVNLNDYILKINENEFKVIDQKSFVEKYEIVNDIKEKYNKSLYY